MKSKRLLAVVLVLCMFLLAVPVHAAEESAQPLDGDSGTGIQTLTMNESVNVQYQDGNMPVFYFTPAEDGYYALALELEVDANLDIYAAEDGSDYNYLYVAAGSGDKLNVYLRGGVAYEITIWLNESSVASGTLTLAAGVYVSAIEITREPDTLSYVKDCVTADLSGLELKVTWSDGTVSDHIYSESGENIGSFLLQKDSVTDNQDGTATVTISCCGATDTYTVTLTENPVASFELITDDVVPLIENAYYNPISGYSHHVITKDMKFLVTFTDGSTKTLDSTSTVNGYHISASADLQGPGGSNTVTYGLMGHVATYQASFATNPVAGIELVSEPDPLEYGHDDNVVLRSDGRYGLVSDFGYNYEGLTFRINYTDGTSEEVSFADLSWPSYAEKADDFFQFPEYKGYNVEASPYLPEYSPEFTYWIGTFPAVDGKVAMHLQYMGRTLVFNVTLQEHTHTLTKTEAVAPTCTETGTIAYWTCNSCGKHFTDAEATTEATNVTIPAAGHTLTKTEAKDASCTEAGSIAYWTCSSCGKHFTDAGATTEATNVTTPAAGHTLTKTEAKAATYTAEGNTEYWTCSVCGKLFADENGTTETDAASVVIPTLVQVDEEVKNQVNVSTDAMDKAIEDSNAGEVVLPLEQVETKVDTAVLPAGSVAQVAEADASLTVNMTEATVTMDTQTLQTVSQAAAQENGTVTLQVEVVDQEKMAQLLTETQQAAVENKEVVSVISVSLLVESASGTVDVHDFGGGSVTIRLPFTPEEGTEGSDYTILYIADDGTVEEIATTYAGGYLVFTLDHFSEYVVVNTSTATTPIDPTNPSTGDSMNHVLVITLMVTAAAAVVLLVSQRKRFIK